MEKYLKNEKSSNDDFLLNIPIRMFKYLNYHVTEVTVIK